MALSVSVLASGGVSTDSTSYNTASVAPADNALCLLCVSHGLGGPSTAPTSVSGGGMAAWTAAGSPVSYDGGVRRLDVYRALEASPGSGAVTITFAETQTFCHWVLLQFTGNDTSGANGSGAVGTPGIGTQANGTSLALSIGALASSESAMVCFFGHKKNEATNVGAGFTELFDLATTVPSMGTESQWAFNATACTATWLTSESGGGWAVEVKAAAGGAFNDPAPVTAVAQFGIQESYTPGGGGGGGGNNLILPDGVGFAWNTAIDYDLVKVRIPTSGGPNGVTIQGGASGRIGRLEVDTWADLDGIRIGTSADSGQCVVESGYLKHHDKQPLAHQDGIQSRGGANKIFRNLVIISSPLIGGTQGMFCSGTQQNIVVEDSIIGPHWTQTVHIADESAIGGCGIRGSRLSFGDTLDFNGGTNPGVINENNTWVDGETDSVVQQAMIDLKVPWYPADSPGVFNDSTPVTVPTPTFTVTGEGKVADDAAAVTALSTFTIVEDFVIGAPIVYNDACDVTVAAAFAVAEGRVMADQAAVVAAPTFGGFDQYVQSGGILWLSWLDGYNDSLIDVGCSSDLLALNTVVATSVSATDNDRAVRSQVAPGFLPTLAFLKGRVRFRLESITGTYPVAQEIFSLASDTQAPFRLVFDEAGAGAVEARIGRMNGAVEAVVPNVTGGTIVTGAEYLVEYTITRSVSGAQSYQVTCNDVLLAAVTPGPASAIDEVTGILVGPGNAANPPDTPIGMTIRIWDVALAASDVTLPLQPAAAEDPVGFNTGGFRDNRRRRAGRR